MTTKPTLLLHSCCAPCSSSVLERLTEAFDVTVFYYNPNIFPESEYKKRLAEQKTYLQTLGIKIIEGNYNPSEFLKAIKSKEDLPERSARCYECYKLRLTATKNLATKLNFNYFTTTLSVSPHKNADWINQIGNSLSISTCQYLEANFKKQNGYLRSLQLSKQHGFYRQAYCGCEMSMLASLNKLEKKQNV